MSYRIGFTRKAYKQLNSLDRTVVRRIQVFLGRLDRTNPRTVGKPLGGSSFWRYRVGDYRILADINDTEVLVLVVEIGHRREIYQNTELH